ncbi:MAG: hypothetical protein J6K71_02460, partial [Clostridia bacterium]|nr:hypothetical protein [Clostridia bacterium]
VATFGEVSFSYRLIGDEEYHDIDPNNLGILDPGQYELKAYVKPSTNFTDIAPIVIEFEIFAA